MMLAPAVIVTLLVVALGFVLSRDDEPRTASSDRTSEVAAGAQAAGTAAETTSPTATPEFDVNAAKLPGARVVIKAKPLPKFRHVPAFDFRIASFNVLGHSHTVAGGDAARFADSGTRMGISIGALSGAGVDVVGLQELQPQQVGSLIGRAGGTYEVWPGNALGREAGANSIAWRRSEFEMVEVKTINITYFDGAERPMPYVLLQHRATGQRIWVASFHNPANKNNPRGNFHWRRVATEREIVLARTLEATGYPVFFTGDFNERAEYFCPLTAQTELHAAAGGSSGTSCAPPARMEVDWIFGSDRVAFSSYAAIDVPRASDHPLVVATATVPATKERIIYPEGKR